MERRIEGRVSEAGYTAVSRRMRMRSTRIGVYRTTPMKERNNASDIGTSGRRMM